MNADDYILKPFRMTDLLERMSICLERISPPYLHYRSQREQ